MITFKKPFSIQLTNDEIIIKNSHDVDIALSGRTNPSPNRVIKLLESKDEALDKLENDNQEIISTVHEMLILE